MIQSILIGKAIYTILSNDEYISQKLTGKVDEIYKLKVYPLIANSNTTYPYITYKKNNIQSSGTKDGISFDTVSFSISVTDINYNSSCDIANKIREIFERQEFNFNNGFRIHDINLTGVDELWNDEAFVQILTFECRVTN